MMKKRRILRNLLLDALLAGIGLTLFALFHHVLPRQQESVGITISPPTAAADSMAAETGTEKSVSDSRATADRTTADAIAAETDPSAEPATGHSMSASSQAGTASGGRSKSRGGKSRGSGSSEKGGSAVASGGTSSSAEGAADPVSVSEGSPDRSGGETIRTVGSYTGSGISVTVTEHTTADGQVTYYVADIYADDVTSVQTALAGGTYGSGYRDEIGDMAASSGALLAINGDYYGNTQEGVVIRNGVIYRANATDCDVCVLYYDGTMRVMAGSDFSVEEAVADGAWQAWTFGPSLLDADGKAVSVFTSTRRLTSANPRTAIGYYAPGHYCMVVVDGRGESSGMSLAQLSQLFEDLGCKAAYNLDGGNSSVMVWDGDVINQPSGGGRASSDAILLVEVDN